MSKWVNQYWHNVYKLDAFLFFDTELHQHKDFCHATPFIVTLTNTFSPLSRDSTIYKILSSVSIFFKSYFPEVHE